VILYLDTSSLVKLYIEEEFSDSVRAWIETAEVVGTSRVAYTEAMAAFARRLRENDLDQSGFDRICKALTAQWPQFAVMDVDEMAAGSLAVKHGLRGFDAIHLSAALMMQKQASEIIVAFSSFDARLNTAAASEKLQIYSADK